MSIRIKLVVAFALILVLLTTQYAYTYFISEGTHSGYQEMLQDADFQLNLREIQSLMNGISNDERGYLLTGDAAYTAQLTEEDAKIKALLTASLNSSTLDDSDRAALTDIQAKYTAFYGISQQVVAAMKAGKTKEAQTLHLEQERQIRKQVDDSMNALVLKVDEERAADMTDRKGESDSLIMSIVLSFALVAVAAIVIGLVLGRMIVRPIVRMNAQLREIAEGSGDLSRVIELRSRDELGKMAESFNKMVLNLRSILLQAKDTAIQVASSSEQLTASAEQTTRATEQIVESTQQIAVSSETEQRQMEEAVGSIQSMSSGIAQVAQVNEEVLRLAQSASEASSTGAVAVGEVLQQMESVHQTVDRASSVIETLGNRSMQISSISSLITDLANRTNILSLNAGIEAARAGEHGKGFAVVAQEIRKLAEQSRQSAQQIAELIEAIVEETQLAVVSMRDGTEKVGTGLVRTREVNEMFSRIDSTVSAVAQQALATSSTARELAESSRNIVEVVEAVAASSEQVAASCQSNSAATEEQLATMEEISSSSNALSRLADDLHNVLSRFKLH
ncbi:methyl-accepting chemotaxis protein [Paenibacillus koleovorans]|uniref:methyl-accepting chemotaxis protein n=1 Tax=Paenibacillus koleovorans TaxID=121608 RepID=UPI000FD83F9B|nr:methyl-accepting chemotaxis protein [Paenibacillus koleovorans]